MIRIICMLVITGLMVSDFILPLVVAQETTREGVTVIQPGPGGEVRVISTETVKQEKRRTARSTEGNAKSLKDQARKARVVVVPAIIAQERRRRIDRELNERFGITDPGVWESPGYTSYIVDALVNTRKFDVMERGELSQLVKEMEFGESEFVDPNQAVKVGNMAGADYIIVPEISYLESEKTQKKVPYVGGTTVQLVLKLGTSVRTVDVSSGRIISSYVNKVEKSRKMRDQSSDPRKAEKVAIVQLMAEAFKDSALVEAANIVDVAYPIRVMSVMDDYVILNRGRGAIVKGEKLKVFNVGEVMIDPDTGENLGYQEAYVGALQVTDVDMKTCKAKIVDGNGKIKKLAVCRRVAPPSARVPEGSKPAAPRID